jgi:hypothetical protein
MPWKNGLPSVATLNPTTKSADRAAGIDPITQAAATAATQRFILDMALSQRTIEIAFNLYDKFARLRFGRKPYLDLLCPTATGAHAATQPD